jgi:hypothetical protein
MIPVVATLTAVAMEAETMGVVVAKVAAATLCEEFMLDIGAS